MSSGTYLGLGSNLGNRAANIALALRMLAPLARVEAVSRLYESASADGSDQPDYYDAACRIVTGLTPDLLLAHVKRVEYMLGRRLSARWSARPIDIDILLFGDRVLETDALTIPHPRLAERAFAVRPLLDLEQELALPDGGRLEDLPAGRQEIAVVAEGEWWQDARTVGLPATAGVLSP